MISSMNSKQLKTVLITGANKGIGFGMLKGLLRMDKDYNLILTARDEEKGKQSLKKIKNEFKTKADRLFYHQLDVTDDSSISNCVDWLKKSFGQTDMLVNNAGVYDKGDFSIENYNYTFPTNVDGTMRLTEMIIKDDLIKSGGKIICVGSTLGNLKDLNENLRLEFMDNNLTVFDLYNFSKRFKGAIINNSLKEEGWGGSVYGISKMIINTYPRVLSNRKEIQDRNIGVYACHPGWVQTDMTAGTPAPLTVEEGVVTPLYVVDLPEGINEVIQGKYFDRCKVKSYFY